MKRALAYGISTTLLLAMGCDPDGGTSDDGVQFREDIGYVQVRTQTASFSSKGCDPPWGDWGPAAPSLDEKEWSAMIYYQARMVADETLVAAFLAQPDVENFCAESCKKIGAEWNGRAQIVKVEHDFGGIEVTGECPSGAIATSIPTESEGDIACACGGE